MRIYLQEVAPGSKTRMKQSSHPSSKHTAKIYTTKNITW